jgi:hypothetical protein
LLGISRFARFQVYLTNNKTKSENQPDENLWSIGFFPTIIPSSCNKNSSTKHDNMKTFAYIFKLHFNYDVPSVKTKFIPEISTHLSSAKPGH